MTAWRAMIRAAGPILVGGWLIDIMTGTYLGRQDRSYAGQMIIWTTTRYRMHFVWYGARVCSVSLLSARVCNTFTLGIWIIPTSRYSSADSRVRPFVLVVVACHDHISSWDERERGPAIAASSPAASSSSKAHSSRAIVYTTRCWMHGRWWTTRRRPRLKWLAFPTARPHQRTGPVQTWTSRIARQRRILYLVLSFSFLLLSCSFGPLKRQEKYKLIHTRRYKRQRPNDWSLPLTCANRLHHLWWILDHHRLREVRPSPAKVRLPLWLYKYSLPITWCRLCSLNHLFSTEFGRIGSLFRRDATSLDWATPTIKASKHQSVALLFE